MSEDGTGRAKGWLWGGAALVTGLIVAFGSLSLDDDPTGLGGAASDAAEASADAAGDAADAAGDAADAAGDAADAAGDAADAAADAAGDAADAAGDAVDAAGDAADAAGDAVGNAADAATNPDLIPTVGSDGAELGCTLAANSASSSFTPDAALVENLAAAGVSVAPIAPAVANGDAIDFTVRASRVACDGLSGYIGHRGGVVFTDGTTRVELRRYRVDLADGSVLAFPKSSGSDSIAPFALDVAAAEASETDDVVASNVPVSLTADGANAVNTALGADLVEEGATLGTMTFSGQRQ